MYTKVKKVGDIEFGHLKMPDDTFRILTLNHQRKIIGVLAFGKSPEEAVEIINKFIAREMVIK